MDVTFLTAALKPIIALALFVLVVIPIEWLFIKFFPDCWLKRLLLKRIS
jgi:hypothetical protein